ncbi:DNA polymerase kappa isoform X2 [Labeo rohita]|uniref:DNA polymerase kappa isoform X1 n=1 Tax=Labeo rohita TaxID=84645 RepID=UPI0021E2B98A|nr:DNA polymerase kappa isoform X1 [Labeo rohita]XP_050965058.1 DNA polymerase kappa isoform X2 [Labeo rohita]
MENHQGAASSSSGADLLSRIALNDNKAGMEGLDRDKINKIILETSKGSRFYENELKKEQQVNQRIEKMMEQKAKITEEQMKQAQAEVDKLTCELERSRELSRLIVHVDMDAFYAAVEMRDCPELKDKPMAVGSTSMLSTSNYHARRFGVRAAMPGFIAKKLCPNLVIVPTNFDKYRAVSAQVREIFSEYDPHFMPMSLDEAYLDITEHLEQRKHWPETMRTYYTCDAKTGNNAERSAAEPEKDGLSPVLFEDSPSSSPSLSGPDRKSEVFGTSAEEAVREMRFRIEQKTSLTASAGIAPNMMLAKVCSDKNKPNGQYRIPPERQVVMEFMKELPVRKVSGVGKVTEKMLAALGIVNCAQLGQQMALLSLLFSGTSWHHFLHISLGLGSTCIERDSERKSMSTERTFGEMSDAEEQYSLCRDLCHDLAQDLQREGLKGKTVTLKLKNVKFEVKTKAFTLQYAVCTEEEIFAAAKDLLKAEIDSVSPQPLKLRLMGVRVSGFISAEDKKPLQRSIMGFLQKGGSDSSGFTQCAGSALKAEESSEGASFLKPQSTEIKAPSVSEQTPKSRGPQQQSFFQRAQLKRLQQQREQMPVIAGTDTTNNSADAGAAAQTDLPTTNTQSDATSAKNLSNTNSETDATSYVNKPAVLKPSFKITTQVLQSLTCPVCNIEMKDVNLTAFNNHIDECLKGSAVDNEPTDLDATEKQEELNSKPPASNSESKTLKSSSHDPPSNEEKPSTSISVTLVETDDSSDFKTPFFTHKTKINGKRSVIPKKKVHSETSSKASPTRHNVEDVTEMSSDSKGSSLTCPVCSQPQSTDDLALFNRHVDMCLNQEVLLEFKESHPPVDHSDAPALKSVKGQLGDQGRVSKVREKSKRQGSSPLPPSKKIKVLSTKHTIDKFFKGSPRQNV